VGSVTVEIHITHPHFDGLRGDGFIIWPSIDLLINHLIFGVDLSGESPAAMQHGCSARQLSSAALFFLSVAMAVAANVKAHRNIWSFIYGVT
jgi:hypothetical protein